MEEAMTHAWFFFQLIVSICKCRDVFYFFLFLFFFLVSSRSIVGYVGEVVKLFRRGQLRSL